jgi:oligopeptide transport system substrate-binding protein
VAGVLTGPRPLKGLPAPRQIAIGLAVLLAAGLLAAGWWRQAAGAAGGPGDEVRILSGAGVTTVDPAAQGDVGGAGVAAQLFESLTALDPGLTVRPALAAAWDIEDGGRRIVFHLRDGLTFSDGTPLRGEDVVRSWLRIIDPDAPSPLSALMVDVEGAAERLAGAGDESGVGLSADGLDVEVRLVRPAADFISIVSGPTFAIVPSGMEPGQPISSSDFVGSGAYLLADASDTGLTLTANPRYWAGPPAIATVHLVDDIGGRSAVAAFEEGDLDYTGIASFDASWIRYDANLGPLLREVPSLVVEYLGFDTSRPPFDDVRVRRAFGQAVDWNRIVALADGAASLPANSMVPPGIPGRSEASFLPTHDPDAARSLLADAGFAGGAGFPEVTFMTGGSGYAGAIVTDLERELGIEVRYETSDFGEYVERLESDPPAIWSMAWVADYPGRNDFLGVLLRAGSSNNYGRWSNGDFEAALDEAGAAQDAAAADAAYDRAESVLQSEVPVIPLAYGTGWALSRDGLLGAGENGLGILRIAGLAWDE